MSGENALQTLRSAATWIGVAAGVLVLWEIRDALLLGLGAILAAIFLRFIMDLICRATGLPDAVALSVAVLFMIAVFALCFWLFGMRLSTQFVEVGHHIREGEKSFAALLGPAAQGAIQRALSLVGDAVPVFLSMGIEFLEFAVITAIAAIYLAAQPEIYRRGAAALFPRSVRAKALETLDLIGASLRLWLMGQLILMFSVGVLSYVAALTVGLPNPVALGLIAGVTEMIPYLGPFIGGVPAVLVALTRGLMPALWILIAYVFVHMFEGYLVGPLLQRWFVRIPPALVLIAIVASQMLFGVPGIILAAPLIVVIYTATKFLYVGATLKQHVDLPTEAPF
ncbi:MAG TPA: AI-2E family transporter [Rhizomicrobium sp.]